MFAIFIQSHLSNCLFILCQSWKVEIVLSAFTGHYCVKNNNHRWAHLSGKEILQDFPWHKCFGDLGDLLLYLSRLDWIYNQYRFFLSSLIFWSILLTYFVFFKITLYGLHLFSIYGCNNLFPLVLIGWVNKKGRNWLKSPQIDYLLTFFNITY